MTWKALGPYPQPGDENPPPALMEIEGQADLGGPGVRFEVREVAGLLEPFNGRARRYLLALLRGASHGMASTACGVNNDTVTAWKKRYPEFAHASARCAHLGFTVVFETELYQRALDRDDRSSGRLLELVVKSRDAAYREKSQVMLDVQLRAAESTLNLAGGWRQALPEHTDTASAGE